MKTFASKNKQQTSRAFPAVCSPQKVINPSVPSHQSHIHHILHPHPIQPKLTIGSSNDQYEHEADRAAEQVMRMPESACPECKEEELVQTKPLAEQITPLMQRQVEEEEEEEKEEETVQKKAELQLQRQEEEEEEEEPVQAKSDAKHVPEVTPSLASRIQAIRGGGQPLPKSERSFFEPRFGRDFNDVRIHTDSKTADVARSVKAQAFTVGRDVFFGEGQYAPGKTEGRRLLGHELTHVVQQGDYSTNNILFLPKYPQQRVFYNIQNIQIIKDNQINRKPKSASYTRKKAIKGRKPTIGIIIDTKKARIDKSKGIDEITMDFYHIPVELLPRKDLIPAPPVLTLGRYGCKLRRYGLTVPSFALSFILKESDIKRSIRPFDADEGLYTVECWTNHIKFKARLRQTILIPNDIATHRCMEGTDPKEEEKKTLAHEQLHEMDHNLAVERVKESLRNKLMDTAGVGRSMAMVRITDDPDYFVSECEMKLWESFDKIKSDHDIMFHQLITEYAIKRDPHDKELHMLKLRLLKKARARART